MSAVLIFLKVVTYIVIADAVLSWVVRSPDAFPRNITSRLTEPLYRPIRAVLDPQKTGGIDLSPLIVIFAIQALRSLLLSSAGY